MEILLKVLSHFVPAVDNAECDKNMIKCIKKKQS